MYPFGKAKHQLPSLLGDVADACLRRRCPQQRHLQQRRHGLRRLSEPIQQFVQQLAGILRRAHGGNAAIQIHPLPGLGYISVRDIGRYGQVRCAFRANLRRLALLLQNRVAEQLQIHVVSNAHHIARLFRPQQVACAPYFQIPHGNLDTGAQLRELPDGLQALLRFFL